MRSSPEFDLTMHCSTIFCGLQTMSQSIYIWIGQLKPLKSTRRGETKTVFVC